MDQLIGGGSNNNPVGPIMMFQTEDEEEVYGEEVEDMVFGL